VKGGKKIKKIVIILVVVLCAMSANQIFASYALISNVSKSGFNSPQTTSAIDTTGVDLLVVSISDYVGFGNPTLTDSKSNTWILAKSKSGTVSNLFIYYCHNPVVGSGHTFTATGSGATSMNVMGFSGSASSPLDQTNSATVSGGSLATGSITPSQSNELIIAVAAPTDGTSTYSVNSGFTTTYNINAGTGVNEGLISSYLIQTTATAVNPTFSWSGTGDASAAIVSFKTTGSVSSFSCSVTTAGSCSGVVLLRMSNSSNAHAEIPSMSTDAYNNNVVCCTGPAGLGNSCSGNYAVIARLSGTSGTNAHVEENNQTTSTYNTEQACLSSSFAGDQITIGYQANNCTGFDTTLFSMDKFPTDAMVGNASAYNNKVCGKVFSQSISFNLSSPSAGFGNLTSSGLRYATSDGVGSATETESYHIDVSTNAPAGYIVSLEGDPLKKGSSVITPIGGTNLTPTPGTKAFGIRAVASGGTGAVLSPYNGTGFAYSATGSSFSTLASESSGDGNNTTYSVHSVATIDSLLDPGTYSTNITYIVTGNF